MTWWARLTTVDHPDPHTRRRGRLLAIVLLIIIAFAVTAIPLAVLNGSGQAVILMVVAAIVVFGGSLLLARRGMVDLAGWLFIGTMAAAIVGSVATSPRLTSVYFLVLTIITAGLVLPARQMWLVLALALVSNFAILLFRPEAISETINQVTLIGSAMLQITATILSYLGARAVQEALATAEAAAARAEAALARSEEQARSLTTQAEALRRTEDQLHDLVATLETPMVTLADGVLLAPLIGSIDSRRTQLLTDRLLHSVASQRVRLLILDIGGVSLIDTAVAHTLLQVTRAVRLLGCRVVLTGIAPSVAITLTHLGVDLGGIETARSPQDVAF